jgi:hypothetical protein
MLFHGLKKLTDCDGESNETDTSLDFARDCGYITVAEYDDLAAQNRSVGRMLGSMIKDPSGFLITERKTEYRGRKPAASRSPSSVRRPPV